MSYILQPKGGASLNAGQVVVSGVACTDGLTRLESVQVSFDCGRSWQSAQFVAPESPHAWYLWTTQAKLDRGARQIWCRAIDRLGRAQPVDGPVLQYLDDFEPACAHKINVTVA